MFEVLEVRNDQTAVVSTAGLYCVIVPKKTKKGKWKNRVIGEMLRLSEADAVADTYNAVNATKKGKCPSEVRARVMDYESVYIHCSTQVGYDADITIYDRGSIDNPVAREVHRKFVAEA